MKKKNIVKKSNENRVISIFYSSLCVVDMYWVLLKMFIEYNPFEVRILDERENMKSYLNEMQIDQKSPNSDRRRRKRR